MDRQKSGIQTPFRGSRTAIAKRQEDFVKFITEADA